MRKIIKVLFSLLLVTFAVSAQDDGIYDSPLDGYSTYDQNSNSTYTTGTYDDYYYYASRINRFYRPIYGIGYYDPFYINRWSINSYSYYNIYSYGNWGYYNMWNLYRYNYGNIVTVVMIGIGIMVMIGICIMVILMVDIMVIMYMFKILIILEKN